MPPTPETRFTEREGARLAYQVLGEGPDLLFVNGWFTDLELQWEETRLAAYLDRLASFARLILVDKRGMGRSERVAPSEYPSIKTRAADLGAVLDAVGTDRVVVAGASESGPLAAAFAAANPSRSAGLVLISARARYAWPLPDYPFGYGLDELEPWAEQLRAQWGTRAFAEEFYGWMAPSLVADPEAVAWFTRMMPVAADPDTVAAGTRVIYRHDVRDALPRIACPTLVFARSDDVLVPLEEARWLADHIADARFIELEGADHPFWAGDTAGTLEGIEAFVRELA